MTEKKSKSNSGSQESIPVPNEPETDVEHKDICFVIMPFGGWFDNYFENIYSPAILNADLIPKRADNIFRPGSIMKDIWELTKDAKILLADLTTRNPNVLYELGLAHAITKPVILISEDEKDIPFDLKPLRVIIYDKDEPKWGDILQENITKSILETLASPKESIPPTFIETEPFTGKLTLDQIEKDILEIKNTKTSWLV